MSIDLALIDNIRAIMTEGAAATDVVRADMTRAILSLEAALRLYTPEADRGMWSKAQHQLGQCYLHMSIGDRGENLIRSKTCLEAALTVFAVDKTDFYYIDTLSLLREAYEEMQIGDAAANLRRAVECCRAIIEDADRTMYKQEVADARRSLRNLTRNYTSRRQAD